MHGLVNAEDAGMGWDLRIMLEVQNSVDRAGAVRIGTKESESVEWGGEHQVLSALKTRPGRLLILALIYGGENMSK